MDSFSMVANIGRRSPLHTNASGKVLLAGFPTPVIEDILRHELEMLTQFTITDPNELRKELSEVKRNGYATCTQEQEEGLSSVSVPIFDYTGNVHAALTIASPTQRMNQKSIPDLLAQLHHEASLISKQLGGTVRASAKSS